MQNHVSRCGIDCGICPWGPYPRESMTAEEIRRYKSNAKRILGYQPVERPCVTCQTPDSQIPKGLPLPNRKCLIRQCVSKNGMANCAFCSRFPCDTVNATADTWTRENIEKRLGAPITEEDYRVFVKPFEGVSRLKGIRSSLKPEEIIEPVRVSSEARLASFPIPSPFTETETTAFKAVYTLLAAINRSALGLRETDTFAQYHKLEDRRSHILRFIWIIGRYGKPEQADGPGLVIEPSTYLANREIQKKLAFWTFINDTVFKVLFSIGVICERVVLAGIKEQDLTTGTGYLRNRGWLLRMRLTEAAGGKTAITALQTYTRKLHEKWGKHAFKHFSEADMSL